MEQKRFTKEFKEEAARLMRTSSRAKREIADDLGVGLSTLARWLARSRDFRQGGKRRGSCGKMTSGLGKSGVSSGRLTASILGWLCQT